MSGPSRRIPAPGDAVVVQFLGSMVDGRVLEVDGRRLLVASEAGTEWFALSRTTGRFVREGEPYFPRLLWPESEPPSD